MKDGEYKVHIVASVLKKYLGDLPKSVIPPENYDQFIAVGGCKIFIIFFFSNFFIHLILLYDLFLLTNKI